MKQSVVLLVSAFFVFGVACGSSGTKIPGYDPTAAASPTFQSIQKVILQNACVTCHGGEHNRFYDTYENTMKSVSAGNPDGSELYTIVKSGEMPEDGPALSSQHIETIRQWIADGAQNN